MRSRMKPLLSPSTFVLVLTVAGLTGCDALLGPDAEPASIEIRASRSTLVVPGETLLLEAVVKDEGGGRISGFPVTWESRSPAVASVDQSGLLTAVANGATFVVARAGVAEDSLEITIDAPIPCAPVDELVVPDTIPGSIEDGDCEIHGSTGDFWRLTLDRKTEVTVELRSSELDAVLVLVDENGEVIEIDDDGGIGLNSRIHRVLPAATYYLFATSLFADGRGSYELSAFEGGFPSPCPATASITLPDTVTGTITDDACEFNGFYVDVWRLDVPTDTAVVVQLGSDDMVPLIAITDTLGEIIEATHLGPGTDAWIERELTAGSYDLWVSDPTTRRKTGSYTLATRLGPSLVECETEGTIAVGDTVSGELTAESCYLSYGAADGWDLRLEDSTTLEMTIRTDGLAPTIVVSDSSGAVHRVFEGDESAASGQLSLEPGAYRVWARSGYARYGRYSLAVVAASEGLESFESGATLELPPAPGARPGTAGLEGSAWTEEPAGFRGAPVKQGVVPLWLRRMP